MINMDEFLVGMALGAIATYAIMEKLKTISADKKKEKELQTKQ